MACKEKLEAYLREEGVEYELQHHRLAFTAQKIAASEHVPGRMLAKVVMAFAGDDLNMLVMPAHFQVDLEAARRVLAGGAVRLAHEQEFAAAFPDCEPGAMPPFGNLYDIRVYVEEALGRNERIVFQAGTHMDTMSIPYQDFIRLARPTVARLGFIPGKAVRAS